jgi:trigger factor
MNVIENLTMTSTSEHERELTVTIPSAVVGNEFKKTFTKVQRVATRPGFRPGKMPANMVMSFFGAKIKQDLVESLIEKSFADACKNQELIPVSKPKIEPVGEINKENAFIYRAIFQVKPKVAVEKFEGLAIEFKKFTFSDDDIMDELNSIRESMATFQEPKDRSEISANDLVECDSDVLIDGVMNKDYSHQDYSVPLFAENVPADLKESLIGKKVGEKASVKYTMPSDHQDDAIKGKECEMLLTIKAFKERMLPALDDEFAKDLSEKFTSLDDVKDSIKTRFTITAKRRDEYYRQDAITKALVDQNPLEVPPVMVEKMAMSMINRELETMQEKVAEDVVKNHWQELWRSVEARATFRVKAELLLEELIKKMSVVASDEEISERVKKMKEISRDDALYTIQVEKILNVIEKSSTATVVEEPLFKKGN